jgi:acetyltransferase-like isoleucine patch superfamily enzyme
MTPILVVGTTKFALDVKGIIEAVNQHTDATYIHGGYLSVEGEEVSPQAMPAAPFSLELLRSNKVVIAISDAKIRRRFFDEYIEGLRDAAIDIAHPSAILADGCRVGVGNIIGPQCYLGTGSQIGDFNIFNYHVGIGHHSRIGDRNFIAPGFECGNQVRIGNGNFFGLSCTVAPGVEIGDHNRFDAGTLVLDPVADDLVCFSANRLKAVKLPGG